MGLFSAKYKSHELPGNPVARAPQRSQSPTIQADDTSDVEADDTEEKKVYEKEKAVLSTKSEVGDENEEPESETELNTRMNALLYHTSHESIDLYRLENNSLDLLGRLHYDNFDIHDKESVSRVQSFTSFLQILLAQSLNKASATSINNSGTLSPPALRPTPLFESGVSFDTLDDSHHKSIILTAKHPEFKFRRNNKTYLIGYSNDAESLRAVQWVFQEMVIHGDTVVVFQVLDEKHHKVVDADAADKVVEKLKSVNTYNRKISLMYEVTIGRPQKLLKQAIEEYKPAMMIVGSHQYELSPVPSNASLNTHTIQSNHSHFLFLGKTSISKYFLMFALVPVILVKPFYQHQETLKSPIDSDHYFHDMLANIDISRTRERQRKHKFDFLSPTSSRNSSSTNLAAMISPESRGRSTENTNIVVSRGSSISSNLSRSQSRSRSQNRLSRFSKLFSNRTE